MKIVGRNCGATSVVTTLILGLSIVGGIGRSVNAQDADGKQTAPSKQMGHVAETSRSIKPAAITFGRALPENLNAPILDPVIVDYRDGGAVLNAAGTVSAVAAPGDGCRFDAQCNDCNPCTVDSCDDEVCVGGNRDGFACEIDNDCEGLCDGGEKNGLFCRDDLDCCGDGVAIADGSCIFNPCVTFTTGGAEGTGGNQCVNALIPEFACDIGSREGQLCDPNVDPTDLNNGCPSSVLAPTGTCQPRFEQGSECDDGVSCNGRETCNIGTSTCVAGDPADSVSVASFRCDDGNRIGLVCDPNLDPNDECPPAGGQQDPGACVNTRVACEDAGLVCRESDATCVLPCLVDSECPDDGSACTVETCNAKLCVGGATPGVPCREDAECGDGTCSGGGDGSCSVSNPCGGGDCFDGPICVGGDLEGQPCTTADDCDDGSPAGGTCPTPPNGFSCLKGRCCTDGACSKKTFLDCGGTFFGTSQACQTTNSGNFNVCPTFSTGIAPQDNAVLEVGSVIAPQGVNCDLLLTSIGDDYKIGDGTGFVSVTFVRFLISVQSTARLAVAFWDSNGVPIIDTILPGAIGVSGPAIHTLDFDPPLVLPASGFVGIIVAGNFSPAGSYSWISISDTEDVGTSDASIMFVNGVPTDGSSFNLGQCAGGVRDGLWCNAASGDADCTDGVCTDVNDNLAFEIVAILNAPDQTGACCIAETGACASKLPWECAAGGDTFQAVGTTCAACLNDFTQACSVDDDCPACVGGVNDGGACTGDGNCPQGTCSGTATCFLTPPACTITACCNTDGTCGKVEGGLCSNDSSACDNDLDCGIGTCEAQCGAGIGSGFGSTCDPNACLQPIMTGGDNCFEVLPNNITVPNQSEPPVTITVSGNNSTASFDDFNDGVCVGGTLGVAAGGDAGTCSDGSVCLLSTNNCTDGTACLADRCDPDIGICVDSTACSVTLQDCADQSTCQTDDAQCAAVGGGICTRICGNGRNNPAGANADPAWWESFHLDDCADVRIDFCTTNPVLQPAWAFLQAGCPCGATVGNSGTLPPIGPPGADEDSDGSERGLPFCAEDNLWQTFRALPPGTYFYPVNSTPNGTFAVPPGGDYQFHITAGACRVAACCANLCVDGVQAGQPCAPNTCRNGPTPGSECVADGDCGTGGTCDNGGVTSCPGIAANCVAGTCVGGALDGLPCDDLTGVVDQCPGSVCGETGCAEVNEMLCNAANGFWLAGGDFPDNICDGGTTPGAECDTNADCTNGSCIPNNENVSCGAGGASPCDIGSCCAGPGECEDRSPDTGNPIRRIDCPDPRVFRGGGRCLFVPSPCPVCTVLTDDQCQNPNGGFIIGMDRRYANFGAKVADDFIAGSPVIQQFCWWPAFNAGPGGGAFLDCSDPDGAFGPPADDYEIRFFTDKDGFPDTLVHELAPAPVAAKQWRAAGRRSWRFSATFDPPLSGFVVGDKYWVEFSGRGDDNCRVTLLTSEDGNGFALQEQDFFEEFPFWTFQDNAGFDQDFAMCIGGTSTPSILTPPGLTGACCQCGGDCQDDVDWTVCLDYVDFIGPDEPGGAAGFNINAEIPDGQFFPGQTCAELNGGLGCLNVGAGGGCPGAPSGVEGEDCVFPMIVNTGDNISYNTACSTTDGRISYGDSPGCDNGDPGNFVNDQWFQYTATCSGNIQVDLCGDRDDLYDVMFAVFSNGTSECPTECPPPLDTILGGGCRDFECGADVGKPSFEFFGDPGVCYLIRVGGEEDGIGTNIGSSGSGLLQINCETTTCNLADPVLLDQIVTLSSSKVTNTKNRFLSFSVSAPVLGQAARAGRNQAIRIRLVDMPAPYNNWTVDDDNDGLGDTVLWVGEPFELSELGGKNDDSPPTMLAAPLECDLTSALFRDWSALGTVHVFGEAIIPGATYEIQALDTTCSEFIPTHFSDPVTVINPKWADAVGPFNSSEGVWTAPNGSVDVGGDVVAILDKFKSIPSAPKKARVDLQPLILDFKIDILDVTRALDSFSGAQYPFSPTKATPCP